MQDDDGKTGRLSREKQPMLQPMRTGGQGGLHGRIKRPTIASMTMM